MSRNGSPQTFAAVNGIGDDSVFDAVTPPIYLSRTFTFKGFNQPRDYSRAGNPTRGVRGDTIAQLEGGAGAIVVSNGMAAPAASAHACRGHDSERHSHAGPKVS